MSAGYSSRYVVHYIMRPATGGSSQFQTQSMQHWRPDDSSTLRGCFRTQRFDEEDIPRIAQVS